MDVYFVATGDELLRGDVADGNGPLLARRLFAAGHRLTGAATVGDCEDDIAQALERAASSSHWVVVSGGLGPTADDRTAAAIARWVGVPLVEDVDAAARIAAFFAARNRPMPPSNRKQALVPKGARVWPNPVGTAPGFSVEHRGVQVAALPGVPSEFARMCDQYVLPQLGGEPRCTASFHFFGVGESDLAERLAAVEAMPGVRVGYRAVFPRVSVTVRAADAEGLEAASRAVEAAAGQWLYATSTPELSQVVADRAARSGHRVATAESCTGGALAASLTRHPGASAWFLGGVVAYDNAVKCDVLGVPRDLLTELGAVSGPVVEAMARGVRAVTGASVGIATSGIAGPGGGTPDKPVGTVYVGLATDAGVEHKKYLFPYADRTKVVTATVWQCLAWLREVVEHR